MFVCEFAERSQIYNTQQNFRVLAGFDRCQSVNVTGSRQAALVLLWTNTQHAKDKRHQKQAKVVSENLLQLSSTMIHTDTKNFDALPAPRGDDEIRGRLLSKLGIYPGEVLPRQVLPFSLP